MKKKIFGVTVAIIVVIMIVFKPTPYAENNSIIIQSPHEDPIIISQEQINVAGVPVTLTLYNDQGVIVETASIDETISATSKSSALANGEEIDSNELKAKIAELADQRFAERTHKNQSTDSDSSAFNYTKQNSINPNCYVGHWSDHSNNIRMINLLAYEGSVRLTSGGMRGIYNGVGNAATIVLSETITKHGIKLIFLRPWGIGVTKSANSDTWTSSAYTNVSIVTCYRPDFDEKWTNFILTSKLVDIVSRCDIYLKTNGYGTETDITITAH